MIPMRGNADLRWEPGYMIPQVAGEVKSHKHSLIRTGVKVLHREASGLAHTVHVVSMKSLWTHC